MSRLAALDRLRSGAFLGDREVWRRGLGRWLPALAALVVGGLLLVLYLGRFAGRAEVSARSLERERTDLAALRAEHHRLESELTAIATTRDELARFYDERLSTESRRLTRIIAEVKELARRSGLVPQSISYPDQTIEDFDLRKRSFVFSVQGTYADLRKLINLLELSESFLTLEQVDLSGEGSGGGRLNINLTLSTLFATSLGAAGSPAGVEETAPPAAGAPAAPEGAPAAASESSEPGTAT